MPGCLVCDVRFTGRDKNYRLYCASCKPHVQAIQSEARRKLSEYLFPDVQTKQCADCGVRAYAYEHRHYSKPLDVVPVCRACNAKRGAALDIRELARERIGLQDKPHRLARCLSNHA